MVNDRVIKKLAFPPDVKIEKPSQGEVFNQRDVEVRWASSDFDPNRHFFVLFLDDEEIQETATKRTTLENLSEGKHTIEVVALKKTGTIKGHVYDDDGPIERAEIQASGPDTVGVLTNENGDFIIEDLAIGTYDITIKKTGYMERRKVDRDLEEEQVLDLGNIKIYKETPPPGEYDLTVNVYDKEDDHSIEGATVTIDGTTTEEKTTNSNGIAVFTDINGYYDIWVDYPGYLVGGRLDVEINQDTTIDVPLMPEDSKEPSPTPYAFETKDNKKLVAVGSLVACYGYLGYKFLS